MNLEQSITYSHLMQAPPTKVIETTKRSKLDVAKRVFQLAASGGFPYKQQTPEGWAKKWLSSREFVLMEIDINAAASLNINAVASPHKPKNPNRVAHYFNCSADTFDPIVVDLNKRNQGRSYLGYIPEIVVYDGKHRKAAQLQQGRTKILAWVGCKAADKLFKLKKVVRVVDAAHEDIHLPNVDPTNIATSYELYAATVPAVGLKSVTPRQDAGEGGPRPTGIQSKKMKGMGGTAGAGPGASNQGGSGANPLRMNIRSRSTDSIKAELKELLASKERNTVSAERVRKLAGELKRRLEACGARSSGSLIKTTDSSDRKVPPDASDAGPFVDSSDELKWDGHKPQVNAPGTRGWSSETSGVNPAAVAPGAGVGPRLKPDTGATRSEMSRTVFAKSDCKCKGKCAKCQIKAAFKAKGKKVPKIWDEKDGKWIMAVAPPGREAQVKKLKKKFGKKAAFKIAWSQYGEEGKK